MILAVLASDLQKKEMAASPFFIKHEVLTKLLPKPVFVHSVTDTLERIHPDLIRMNGWPGFLKGNILEVCAKEEIRLKAGQLFGEELVFVKDVPGFVSARIVAMIINEAFFTWEAADEQF